MSFEPEYGTVRRARLYHEGVTAAIYATEDGWHYFCCETCGNCGQHWHDEDYATVQALLHVLYTDHTPYLEESDAHRHE